MDWHCYLGLQRTEFYTERRATFSLYEWVRKVLPKPARGSIHTLHSLRTLTLFILVLAGVFTQASRYEDREKYKAAISALSSNQISRFDQLTGELEHYPLHPYLQYRKALLQLSRTNESQAIAIHEDFKEYTFGDRFMALWTDIQFDRGRYQTYVDYYVPAGVVSQCQFAQALLEVGQTEKAFQLLADLWNVAESQDKSCDPGFAAFIRAGKVTNELAWERLHKTLDEGSYQLSRYLFRFMSEGTHSSAERMYEARRNPRLVNNGNRFKDDRWGNDALIYGLVRLARNDPETARGLWLKYRASRSFTDLQRHRLDDELYLWLALDGQTGLPFKEGLSISTLTRLIHTAISQGLWDEAHKWLKTMDPVEIEKPEWQYWQARIWEALGVEGWQEQLQRLATFRTYYGFLAADYIGVEPQLNEAVYTADKAIEERLNTNLQAQMVLEFFAVGERSNGRREWRHVQETLSPEEQMVMVHWFNEKGLSDEAIFAANRGDLTNFLEVRFPKPFLSFFKRGAFVADVPLEFLLAISRQESAFNYRAVSPVGARGLMQMMLATARATAKAHSIRRPSNETLLDPKANIELGSYHVAELAQEFDNNRVLIAMSYNAGKHNTYKWLKRFPVSDTASFIEVIPYSETRGYVKGVLAFSLVYAMREGNQPPLLHPHELEIPVTTFN